MKKLCSRVHKSHLEIKKIKDHVKSVLRIRSAPVGLHSNGRDPTVGMLLIFRIF
jgi:hypothetical protein